MKASSFVALLALISVASSQSDTFTASLTPQNQVKVIEIFDALGAKSSGCPIAFDKYQNSETHNITCGYIVGGVLHSIEHDLETQVGKMAFRNGFQWTSLQAFQDDVYAIGLYVEDGLFLDFWAYEESGLLAVLEYTDEPLPSTDVTTPEPGAGIPEPKTEAEVAAMSPSELGAYTAELLSSPARNLTTLENNARAKAVLDMIGAEMVHCPKGFVIEMRELASVCGRLKADATDKTVSGFFKAVSAVAEQGDLAYTDVGIYEGGEYARGLYTESDMYMDFWAFKGSNYVLINEYPAKYLPNQ